MDLTVDIVGKNTTYKRAPQDPPTHGSVKGKTTENATTTRPKHYMDLLGKSAWERLHPAIRQRFSNDQKATYRGIMTEVYLSFLGRILAQLCRLIGTPLALYSGHNIPITVNVYHDRDLGGYTWERLYKFPKGINRVTSTKCLTNDPGLIEVLGRGVGMMLATKEENGGICFISVGYFWQCLGIKIPLPRFLAPGRTTVKQTALNSTRFLFELTLIHPLFGCIARQSGEFSAID